MSQSDFWGALGGGLLQLPTQFALQKYSADRAHGSAEWAMRESERLSGSQHQRQVADLKAAGLNPVLSAMGGGAPAHAQASPVPDFGQAAGGISNHVLGVSQLANQLRSTDATIRLQDGQTASALADATTKLLEQENIPTARRKMEAETQLASINAQVKDLEKQHSAAALPGAKLTGKMQGSPGFRSAEVGGKVLQSMLHALTLGMAFKGLHQVHRNTSSIKTYPSTAMPGPPNM